MAVRIVTTGAGSALDRGEVDLVAGLVERYGRCTLLVDAPAARDLARRRLADAGCGVGVDALTPAAWIEGLWELLGNGRRLCGALERQLLMADAVARAGDSLAPLRANPGTVRMLARMARDLLPYATPAALSDADDATASVLGLLASYGRALLDRGMAEPCEAADALARMVGGAAPACARCVVVRDVTRLPAYLARLVAAVARAGEAVFLLRGDQAVWAGELASAFGALGCEVVRCGAPGPDGPNRAPRPRFLEVAGPHARARALADELARLAAGLPPAAPRRVVAASARPAEAFDALSAHLAARGLPARAVRFSRFRETDAGGQFAALSDLVARMAASACGEGDDSAWWPAPELTDWLYCPLSGADASSARAFDKKVRSTRSLGVEGVLRALQGVQSRISAARAKLPDGSAYAGVPAVCADVVRFLQQGRPVSAWKAMHSVALALPDSAFGGADGAVRAAAERSMTARALEVLSETARSLDVSQAAAVGCLDGLCAATGLASEPERVPDGAVTVEFMTLADAARLPAGSVGAVLVADLDVASYPLSHEEGPLATLAARLGCAPLELEPAARLRDEAARALAAGAGDAVLARVTHDRQAKDRYPAAVWTELAAARSEEPARTGEDDVAGDFDPAGSPGRVERVACLPPQRLSDAAVPHLVLTRRAEDGGLVARQFSASQIESYARCPLCWFVSSRVRPAAIDAGFGNMEAGNFVHDVMDRFHERLREVGLSRVTRENLDASLAVLAEVFSDVRAEHGRGKTSSSAPLVPLSAVERRQVDDILPQLRRVVRYEASALAPFAPEYLEYSFNGLGVDYAGWPLGGRIDRVDVDAEGRAVVIDYKHRADANPFRLKDPTVPDRRTGAAPVEDPRWLPEHTQTLIYAQALRRALGLDVRGALYFSTKGRVAMRGAVSAELAEEEPGDGRVPGLRDGFPSADGGSMGFDELLDRVEAGVAERLSELSRGVVAASDDPAPACTRNHPLGFERRDA